MPAVMELEDEVGRLPAARLARPTHTNDVALLLLVVGLLRGCGAGGASGAQPPAAGQGAPPGPSCTPPAPAVAHAAAAAVLHSPLRHQAGFQLLSLRLLPPPPPLPPPRPTGSALRTVRYVAYLSVSRPHTLPRTPRPALRCAVVRCCDVSSHRLLLLLAVARPRDWLTRPPTLALSLSHSRARRRRLCRLRT